VRRDVEARRYDRSRRGVAIQAPRPDPEKAALFRAAGRGRGLDLHAYWPERLNNDAMHKWFRQLILESLSAAD
jgi:DNA-binding transcriptional LysR family regulator